MAISAGTESIVSDIELIKAAVYAKLGNTGWSGNFRALYNPNTAAAFHRGTWLKEILKYSGDRVSTLTNPSEDNFQLSHASFRTYYGQFNGTYFIPDNKIIFIPVTSAGTMIPGLGCLVTGPSPYADGVNRPGNMVVTRSIQRIDQLGIDLYMKSRPLPVIMRPDLLTITDVS